MAENLTYEEWLITMKTWDVIDEYLFPPSMKTRIQIGRDAVGEFESDIFAAIMEVLMKE
jgi:hypothetical protein